MKTKLLKGVLLLSVMLLTVFAAQLPALAVTEEEQAAFLALTEEEQAAIESAIANADTDPLALAETIAAYPGVCAVITEKYITLYTDLATSVRISNSISDFLTDTDNLELKGKFERAAQDTYADLGFAEAYSPPAPPGPALPVRGPAGAPGGGTGLEGSCASCT
jgi:hypothetical protein